MQNYYIEKRIKMGHAYELQKSMSTRKKLFLAFLFLIQLGIIWPGYALFDGIYPMILGLPLSFAWIVAMLLAAFFLLLWYYLSDPEHQKTESEQQAPRN